MGALVLLVGANPLPGWVVWEHLRQNPTFEAVVLACSSGAGGTCAIADRLAAAIREKDPQHDVRTAEFEDPYSVHAVLSAFRPAIDDMNKVHVNFTGGTKVMAVAAARLADELRGRGVQAALSYLDPSTCTLRDEEGLGAGEDLRNRVHVSFEQLCRLHGINVYAPGRRSALFPKTARYLLKCVLAIQPNDVRHSLRWFDENFGSDEDDRAQQRAATAINTTWPPWAPEVGARLAAEAGLDERLGDRLHAGYIPIERRDEVVAFLAGTWLESCVMEALLKGRAFNDVAFNDVAMGVKGNRPAARDFEIDVVAMRGYQLHGVSCSRGQNNGGLKKRGFEIAYRCAQLGGEEARAYLVTLLPMQAPRRRDASVTDLQADLSSDLRGVHSVTVLGRDHLADPDELRRMFAP